MPQSEKKDREDFKVIWDDLNNLMKRWQGRDINLDLVLSTVLLHLLCGFSSSIPNGFGFTKFDEMVPGHKDTALEVQKDYLERN